MLRNLLHDKKVRCQTDMTDNPGVLAAAREGKDFETSEK